MNVLVHMAVDRNEFVFVVDINNRRVLLLQIIDKSVSSENGTYGRSYRLSSSDVEITTSSSLATNAGAAMRYVC